MPRTAKINYQRMTFSFPEKVVEMLRRKVGSQNMSQYVAGLVEADLTVYHEQVDDFMNELAEFRRNVVKKDPRSSLEILREIRYGEK